MKFQVWFLPYTFAPVITKQVGGSFLSPFVLWLDEADTTLIIPRWKGIPIVIQSEAKDFLVPHAYYSLCAHEILPFFGYMNDRICKKNLKS